MMAERGLKDGPATQVSIEDDPKGDPDGAAEDMEGAGQGLDQS